MVADEALAERLSTVRGAIEDAAREALRDPADITTIVVTKYHPASMVRELFQLGVRDFAESRHQDAQPKIASLEDLDATWHFVGQLQSKKARQVASYVDVIHSVDRDSLVGALDRRLRNGALQNSALQASTLQDGALAGGAELEVFIQVNLADDPQRGGVLQDGIHELAEHVLATEGLNLRGLMTVAPLDHDPREAFGTLRALSEKLVTLAPGAAALSMGMSGDYREAILEGATHLRIGTAITGNRPDPG